MCKNLNAPSRIMPGADPSGELLKFANAKGFGNKYKALPLGKDMEQQAQSILDGGIVKGHVYDSSDSSLRLVVYSGG